MIVEVATAEGALAVDLDDEVVLGETEPWEDERPELTLPRVVAAAASGSTIVAVVARRPPLLVSHDAGSTWQEAGGGLPVGFAVAIDGEDPDRLVYAARNRLYVSADGGRFWRALELELPDILAVRFAA